MKITQRGPVFESGDHVGEYTIAEPIGSGGMGSVYRARHRTINNWNVAVKVVMGACDDDEMRQRWFREVESLIKVMESPNVVKIYNAGIYTGNGPTIDMKVPYLVMEYVDGTSLSERLSEGFEEPRIVN